MDEIAVAAQIVEGFVDALLVEGIQEDPFDRLLIADVIEDLIDEQLPFPVRVTGVDDSIDVGVGDESVMTLNWSLLAGLTRSFHCLGIIGKSSAFQRLYLGS